ncbi:uncharacterized protein JCM15063_000094 [Sporobolomyces koalae]|uniref:uncharacterized protein n=1 Tax=Sporobolomyces koalae TaxID=500713 RepID=UPI0031755E32
MTIPTSFESLATAPDKRICLQAILKQVVGSRQRKEALLRAGVVEHLVALLRPPLDEPTSLNEDVSTEAAAVLAALSLPSPEAVSIFTSTGAYEAIAKAFTQAYIAAGSSNLVAHKRLDVTLRALKTLFVDHVETISTSLDVIAPAGPCGIGKLDSHPLMSHSKGKEKEADVNGKYETDRILRALFGDAPLGGSTYDLPFQQFKRGPDAMPTCLEALLELLIETSLPDHPGARLAGSSNRARIADHICTLLSATVRDRRQTNAIAQTGDGEEAMKALERLTHDGPVKVQEAALKAITAITRRSVEALQCLFQEGTKQSAIAKRSHLFSHLAASPSPSLRLAVLAFCVYLDESYLRAAESPINPDHVLTIMMTEPTLRESASRILAVLLFDNPEGQRRAVSASCFVRFAQVLEQVPFPAKAIRSGTSQNEDVSVRNSILTSLVILTAESEPNRRLLLDANLLPRVLESLVHPDLTVRSMACLVVRSLSRSVNILRTDLVEAHAEDALIQLLRSDEDPAVQKTATSVYANLLLEFSPMRQVLIEAGCIPRLCCLANTSEDDGLRMSALWAIKNATYQSSKAFKQSLLQDLTWADLARLIVEDYDLDIKEQALGIIRNLTCVSNNQILNALEDYGEDQLLDLLQHSLTIGRRDSGIAQRLVEQAFYCLNNVATISLTAQLAIASRTQILRWLMHYLDADQAYLRTASLWVIHNLLYRRGTVTSSRHACPNEIVDKFRVLGLESKLRTLERDPELNVRERVRDIKEAML